MPIVCEVQRNEQYYNRQQKYDNYKKCRQPALYEHGGSSEQKMGSRVDLKKEEQLTQQVTCLVTARRRIITTTNLCGKLLNYFFMFLVVLKCKNTGWAKSRLTLGFFATIRVGISGREWPILGLFRLENYSTFTPGYQARNQLGTQRAKTFLRGAQIF